MSGANGPRLVHLRRQPERSTVWSDGYLDQRGRRGSAPPSFIARYASVSPCATCPSCASELGERRRQLGRWPAVGGGGAHGGVRVGEHVVDDGGAPPEDLDELGAGGELLAGGGDPLGDHFLRHLGRCAHPALERVGRRRHHVDERGARADELVVGDLARALDVEVEDRRAPRPRHRLHRVPRRAVEVAVRLDPLDEDARACPPTRGASRPSGSGSGRRRSRPRAARATCASRTSGSRSGSPAAACGSPSTCPRPVGRKKTRTGCSRPTTVARRVRRPRCAFCKFAAAAWSDMWRVRSERSASRA